MSIIFFSLMAGSYEFKHNTKYPSFLICMGCPHWKEEIKQWFEEEGFTKISEGDMKFNINMNGILE